MSPSISPSSVSAPLSFASLLALLFPPTLSPLELEEASSSVSASSMDPASPMVVIVAKVVTVASSPNRTARDVTAVLSDANIPLELPLSLSPLLLPAWPLERPREELGAEEWECEGGHQSTARM